MLDFTSWFKLLQEAYPPSEFTDPAVRGGNEQENMRLLVTQLMTNLGINQEEAMAKLKMLSDPASGQPPSWQTIAQYIKDQKQQVQRNSVMGQAQRSGIMGR